MTSNYLIIPGLNQAPDIFKDILATYPGGNLIKFPSNIPDYKNFLRTPIEDYIQLLGEHLENNEYDYIFAHSLGALIMAAYLFKSGKLKSRIKLISPAFKGRFFSRIIPIFDRDISIPSFNRREWRVHPSCKISHYQQIIELQNRLRFNDLNEFDNVEIIFDPRDEMINLNGLDSLRNRREHYSKNFPRHLCIDYIEKELFTLLR